MLIESINSPLEFRDRFFTQWVGNICSSWGGCDDRDVFFILMINDYEDVDNHGDGDDSRYDDGDVDYHGGV